jgi:hypothetical protein
MTMKRALTLFLVLSLTAACSRTNPTVTPPPATLEPAAVSPTLPAAEAIRSTSASTTPATETPAVNMPLLYISGTSHIESNPKSWPQPDAFLAFLQQVTDLGMRWSVGADVGWLEQEPRAAEIIQKSEAMGVQWDVHAHEAVDRAKVAYLVSQMGGHPNSVVSGMLVTELDGLRQPLTYQGYTWTPRVLWGGTLCAGHRPGCDDTAAGIWIPLSTDQYQTHDSNGTLIRVGGGTHQLADARALAQSIAAGQYTYPVISFTVMIAPSTLKIVESGDGLEQIAAFVNEMNAYSFVRWATIEETAQAWVQAGSVPSRIEMP